MWSLVAWYDTSITSIDLGGNWVDRDKTGPATIVTWADDLAEEEDEKIPSDYEHLDSFVPATQKVPSQLDEAETTRDEPEGDT